MKDAFKIFFDDDGVARKAPEYSITLYFETEEEMNNTCYRLRNNGIFANEYQKLAARTINPDLTTNEQSYHALHGMVGEIGEIHSIYQKTYQGHDVDVEHLKKEVGDLLWFIAEYCTSFGWTLEEVMLMNIDKLKERYPDGFDTDKSMRRREGDI